jgi:spore coat polysaccharide biosynthesis protein SpsF (cytidylyltransferase family)
MYDHSKYLYIDKPKELKDCFFRVCVDVANDYELVKKLYKKYNRIPTWSEIVYLIKTEYPNSIGGVN